MLASILRYRGLIYAIAQRDLKSRYIGSTLGPLWLLLPPVFMVFIYTIIFSQIMRARMPGVEHQYAYSVYLCAGLVTWNLMLELVQRSKGLFIEHANLIKKASFPKFILFIPVLAVALLNSCILLVLVLGFMLLSGFPLTSGLLMLIPALAATMLLGLVTGALLAILNVFFRDVGQLTDIVFQALFWATPIVYPVTILSDSMQRMLAWNPLFPLVRTAQSAFLGEAPAIAPLAYPLAVSTVILILAAVLYRRSYADLLDQI
ncbi:ABC transporter permease [Stutzerimonas kunmingensis]|uniref:ABC transporter permease n=1 Tax=Stutzerimonas kunmingensis TaxID=1211807 RepID=UPI00241CA097|nr:ABC transporter permease [Stutzerimonas kunmingensis]